MSDRIPIEISLSEEMHERLVQLQQQLTDRPQMSELIQRAIEAYLKGYEVNSGPRLHWENAPYPPSPLRGIALPTPPPDHRFGHFIPYSDTQHYTEGSEWREVTLEQRQYGFQVSALRFHTHEVAVGSTLGLISAHDATILGEATVEAIKFVWRNALVEDDRALLATPDWDGKNQAGWLLILALISD